MLALLKGEALEEFTLQVRVIMFRDRIGVKAVFSLDMRKRHRGDESD